MQMGALGGVQTVGAAMLKPQEAKVVRTRGTDNKLVLAERRQLFYSKAVKLKRPI